MTHPLASVEAGKIVVVASSDNNYAIPLHVMFYSLLANTANPERFELFVIDGGINERERQAMLSDLGALGGTITFLDVDASAYRDFPTKGHISAPAYYRISIPDLFDQSVTRAIYLDCDLIVAADIQSLWDVSLGEHSVAAVENVAGSTYKKSGLPQEDYFNSGVMVIDLEKWRELDIPDRVRAFKLDHPELISTNDQCAFNGVFGGEWKRLPLHWNMQSGIYNKTSQVKRIQKSGELYRATWDPSIIHYVGWSKPWVQPCFHPLEGEYRRYLDQTRYRGMTRQVENTPDDYSWLRLRKREWRKRRWQAKYRAKGYNLYSE